MVLFTSAQSWSDQTSCVQAGEHLRVYLKTPSIISDHTSLDPGLQSPGPEGLLAPHTSKSVESWSRGGSDPSHFQVCLVLIGHVDDEENV